MQVVVFASQKGGSGKSTLSGHIAVAAERAGVGPVALIDTDPQASMANWAKAREAYKPACKLATVETLAEELERLEKEGVRVVVVDTPPAATSAIGAVIGHADLVVIPTRPSPHDLRAVGRTVDMVEARGKPLVFALNGATPRARLTTDAAFALSQHGTVAPVVVHNRLDYAASMIDGRTVMEVDPSGKSADEVNRLWQYIWTRLNRPAQLAEESHLAAALAPAVEAPAPAAEESVAAAPAAAALPPAAPAVYGPVPGAHPAPEEGGERSGFGGFALRRQAPAFGRRVAYRP
jgi:chromosome partitioning protein